uniref:Ig-like domain-containing protein n=1 Tax=Pygocentrus nattereri TaxID=42514 RepID=A0A3B4DBS7_PYGNA
DDVENGPILKGCLLERTEAVIKLKGEANFKVVGPAAPLVAEAGEDLVLPCSVKPSISVVDMRVEWFRLHQTDSVVHVYDGYEDSNEYQMESYRGRTALFKEELQKGNTSLKLSALQISDEGAYKCYIESMSWSDDVTVYVEVKGKNIFSNHHNFPVDTSRLSPKAGKRYLSRLAVFSSWLT